MRGLILHSLLHLLPWSLHELNVVLPWLNLDLTMWLVLVIAYEQKQQSASFRPRHQEPCISTCSLAFLPLLEESFLPHCSCQLHPEPQNESTGARAALVNPQNCSQKQSHPAKPKLDCLSPIPPTEGQAIIHDCCWKSLSLERVSYPAIVNSYASFHLYPHRWPNSDRVRWWHLLPDWTMLHILPKCWLGSLWTLPRGVL